MNYFGYIFDYFVPPEYPPHDHIKPDFSTKIVKAKNIDSGEDVWLEMPVSPFDVRRLKDARVHDGNSV
jgi:hypothetical protein